MKISRRDFLKSIMAASALTVVPYVDLILDKEKIGYSETDWREPMDQAVRVKQFLIWRPHKIKNKLYDGYETTITISYNQTLTEEIYKIKKKQALNSLFERIQHIEKLKHFELVPLTD